MKKTNNKVLCLFLCFILIFILSGCNKNNNENFQKSEDLWKNAIYTQDTEFGNGKSTVYAEVKAQDKSVTFTIKTDKKVLSEALLENNLIEGETDKFGLYIKKVNGISADYDTDKSYWGFYKNGEMMMVGVSEAAITDGEHYELVYSK